MAGFLYYLPGGKGVGTDALRALGLERVFRGASVTTGAIDSGPGSTAGLLFAISGEGKPRLAYKSDKQIWNKYEKFWIGYDREDKPGPDDLARKEIVPGYVVVLSDGNKWQIPTAPALPSYLGITADGSRARKPHPDYATLSTMGARVMDVFEAANISDGETTSEAPALTVEEEADICLECLATNYRLGVCEADALCLLTDSDRQRILFGLIDILNQDIAKKKDGSGSGQPES